ncbi:MAG: outer membrane lipoprotein-sorting protein [Mariprofundaceae bacterium]
MKNTNAIRTLALAAGLMSAAGVAQAMSAGEIMEKAHLAVYYAGDDGKAQVHMEIVNPDGGRRIREFAILRKDVAEGGDQMFFVHFRKPADVRGMSFLVHKHPLGDDERKLFIPAIRMVKRIAPGDARTAFVGSDYTYEDISGRHPSKDDSELLGEETLDGRKAWVIRNTPKQPQRDYAWRKTWVDQETFLVLRESYFDEAGSEVKRFTMTKWQKVGDWWIGMAGRMENLVTPHYTTVEFSDVQLNIGVPDKVFSERSLRNPPKRWVK